MSAIEIAVIAEVVFFLSVSEKKDTLMWLSPLVFVQLVAVFSFQKGAISQTLQRNPLARSAGLYSYSIYMLHPFLFSMAVFAMAKVNLTLSAGRATLVIIGLVGILLVLSRIAYNHIEMLGLSLVRAKRLLVTPS